MATPIITPFDNSPFIRGSAQAFNQAIQTGSQAIAGGVMKSREAAKIADKKEKTKSGLIDQFLSVAGEQYDVTDKAFGPKVQEPLVDVDSFESEGQPISKEFQRAGKQSVPTRSVDGPALKRKLNYQSNLKRNLENLTPKEIKAAQDGYQLYITHKTEFQKKHGKDALQWSEPTVQEMIKSDRLEDRYIKMTSEYETTKKTEYIESKMIEYMKLSQKEKREPTEEGFYQWHITTNGAPNDEFYGNGPNKNQPLPDNLDKGRWKGKHISSIASADTQRLVKSTFSTQNQVRTNERLEKNKLDADNKAADAKVDKEQTQKNNAEGKAIRAFERATDKITGNLKSAQKILDNADKAKRNFGNNVLDSGNPLSGKSLEDLDILILKKKEAVAQAEDEKTVVDALARMNYKGSLNQSVIRNFTKDVFDDIPDREGTDVYNIRQQIPGLEIQKPEAILESDKIGPQRPLAERQAISQQQADFGQEPQNPALRGTAPQGTTPAQAPAQAPSPTTSAPETVAIDGQEIPIKQSFQTIGQARKAKREGRVSKGDMIWIEELKKPSRVK